MADKFTEQRVRVVWTGLEFGVKLYAHEEVVRRDFHRLAERAVGRRARDLHAALFKLFAVIVIELETVAVALLNEIRAVRFLHSLAKDDAGICPEPHRAAHLHAVLIGHEVDDGMLAFGVELRRVRVLDPENVAGIFDDRDLHPEADAEVRNIVLAGITAGKHLAFDPSSAESAGDDYAVRAVQPRRNILFGERFGVHPIDLDFRARLVAAVRERLGNGKVCVVELHVLAAERDFHVLLPRMNARKHRLPLRHVDLFGIEMEDLADDGGKIALFKHHGRLVQHGNGEILDAALGRNVAEHCDLLADALRHGRVDARHDDVGENAHSLQFLDGVLGGFALKLARTRNIRNERDVDKAAVFAPHFARDLTDGFEEGLALDVARRSADLRDDNVGVRRLADLINKGLDLVGDVRNDLHGLPEILARALLGEHVPIDFTRRKVGELVQIFIDKALVVTEVEVGLRAVFRDEHLAVLIRAHRAGVDIDIGIEFLRRDFVAAHFQKSAQRCRRNALAESRYNAARDKDVFCHK